jgi:hypothetical protein
MLHRITVRNFKRFDDLDLELGDTVVFIGPNNSGKTSALQALALWDLGLRRWHEKRAKGGAKKRSGVAVNRRDLLSVPLPDTALLWKDLHLRDSEKGEDGKTRTQNVRIEIVVQGVSDTETWQCGLEFDYANSESLYVRPLGALSADEVPAVPPTALQQRVAFLPPMSGLAANETRLDPGAVQVRLGEGRTAEVLRNLCYQLYQDHQTDDRWEALKRSMTELFGITLEPPDYIPERGEVSMSFREHSGIRLDLSAAGRGLQQTLLLLAYASLNPNTVLLLDEPDAHLEILRQRQIYHTLTESIRNTGGQLLIASHSEVLLNEAADRDMVVAFVGTPHRIDDRGSQVSKALRSIGFEQYYQAEQTGWVLYLEGSTDLAVLRELARILEHPARPLLERPFVHYVENQATKAAEHFFGLKEAKQDLVGLVVLDCQDNPLQDRGDLRITTWKRREIENYLCFPEVLEAYASQLAADRSVGPLFEDTERQKLTALMRECLEDRIPRAALRDPMDLWWHKVKATDEFLDPLFETFFARLRLPNLMRKTDYHRLAPFVPRGKVDGEVAAKLDLLVEVAGRAHPRR